MALRQLIISKRIAELGEQIKALRDKAPDFEERAAALKTREAELEASVTEITAETSDADKAVVETAVAEFEADQAALDSEKGVNEAETALLEDEIRNLQNELDELNKKAAPPPAEARTSEERGDHNTMVYRGKFFSDWTPERRSALVAREDVKEFLTRVRELKGQKRAVSGAELTIPDIVLELLRDNMYRYSKLITKVRLKTVSGTARQNITGAVPEGIWMEMTGALKELSISFNQIEVDGFKVGGFIPAHNSILEDSDVNLASEILDAIGQAIGLALDKAILYGGGRAKKMLEGIAYRLAQTAEPSDWGEDAPKWVDLRATNIKKLNLAAKSGVDFFAAMLLELGNAKPNYATGGTFWAMNRKTRMTLMSKAVAFNAAGALVAGQTGTMPIEGGEIVELPFIPDNDIIGGYGSLYLLAERAGAQLAVSEHVRFLQDQTVFKGTARYDGKPVFGEGFMLLNFANVDPTTTVTFAGEAEPEPPEEG